MKIGKFKIQLNSTSIIRGGMLSLVFVLCFGLSANKVQAQTFSELAPAAQQSLIQLFETQMETLRQEVLDPQQGVSIESNKNIFYYYEGVLKDFQEENVELKQAFVSNLNLLLRGPVGNHKLTQTLFYKSLEDAPDFNRSELNMSNSQTSNTNTSGMGAEVSSMLFFQTKEPFRTHLKNMVVTSDDLSKLNALFQYVRNNK